MSRIGIITQARTTSTRLPRKVLLPAGDRTFLDHHLDRLAWSDVTVYIATTVNSADDPITEIAARRGVPMHRGSESDVLSRFRGCVEEHGLDVVVRVTSDCPLIDGRLISEGVAQYLEEADPNLYLSNTVTRTYPRGLDFEVFSADLLKRADLEARTPAEREHVTPWMYSGRDSTVRVVGLASPLDRSGYRITLDTDEDRRLLSRLIEDFGAAGLPWGDVVTLLDAHPELVAINSDVQQKQLDG